VCHDSFEYKVQQRVSHTIIEYMWCAYVISCIYTYHICTSHMYIYKICTCDVMCTHAMCIYDISCTSCIFHVYTCDLYIWSRACTSCICHVYIMYIMYSTSCIYDVHTRRHMYKSQVYTWNYMCTWHMHTRVYMYDMHLSYLARNLVYTCEVHVSNDVYRCHMYIMYTDVLCTYDFMCTHLTCYTSLPHVCRDSFEHKMT